ncbi:MAG: hypothetical protein PWQ08_200 [Clostridiales bacterium]|jgi:anti-sigma28 factor (negative regulator of flagellin synthesis)|nr:hypothetical protein [Clostridiales bacterium]
MKINPAAAFNAYNKTVEKVSSNQSSAAVHPAETTQARAAAAEHTDQVQISAEGARKAGIQQITDAIVSEIHEPASAEKLESLRDAVQNKTYRVSTSNLVDAIMKRWFGAES